MNKILLLFSTILISYSFSYAQDKGIKYSFTRDKNDKELLVEIIFTDSVYKVMVKRIDILESNPFAKSGDFSIEEPSKQFPVIGFKRKILKDFLPANFLDRYEGGINLKDSIVRGDIEVTVCKGNSFFAVLNYQMTLSSKIRANGLIGSLSYFDRQGNELLHLHPYDVSMNDGQIAPKGRYFAHTYGMKWQNGTSMKGGVRVFDNLRKRYFDIAHDSAIITKLTDNYLVVYSYNSSGETPGVSIQYYDLQRSFKYSQEYTEDLASKVTADYGEKATFKIDERIITVENDFAGEEFKWKSYEKDWRVNGQ